MIDLFRELHPGSVVICSLTWHVEKNEQDCEDHHLEKSTTSLSWQSCLLRQLPGIDFQKAVHNSMLLNQLAIYSHTKIYELLFVLEDLGSLIE